MQIAPHDRPQAKIGSSSAPACKPREGMYAPVESNTEYVSTGKPGAFAYPTAGAFCKGIAPVHSARGDEKATYSPPSSDQYVQLVGGWGAYFVAKTINREGLLFPLTQEASYYNSRSTLLQVIFVDWCSVQRAIGCA